MVGPLGETTFSHVTQVMTLEFRKPKVLHSPPTCPTKIRVKERWICLNGQGDGRPKIDIGNLVTLPGRDPRASDYRVTIPLVQNLPIDFKTKVPLWPGQARIEPGQTRPKRNFCFEVN